MQLNATLVFNSTYTPLPYLHSMWSKKSSCLLH